VLRRPVESALTPPIRVVHHARRGPERLSRGVEGDERRVVREIAAHVPADDVARAQIRHEKEVRKVATREAEIRDVADHDLPRGGHRHRFEPIGGDRITMPRIRGLRRTPFARDQAPRLAQLGKQLVAADANAGGRQVRVQLARADARLHSPDGIHLGQHYRVLATPRDTPAATLVVRVPRPPERAADDPDTEAVASTAAGTLAAPR